MKQLSKLYKTNEHLAGLILRITLALVVLPHGCQLLLGWFGGFGFSGSMAYFTQVEKLPWVVGFMVILLQFFLHIYLIVRVTSHDITDGNSRGVDNGFYYCAVCS